MNVTVNSQLLAAELRLLVKIVPSKPAIAILGHVLITAEKELDLYATDLEVGLSTRCSARIENRGSIALPAAKLLQMVEQFPDTDVSISSDKGVVIKCGAFTSKMAAMPAEDFPVQPTVEGPTCTLDAAALRGLIAKTRYAINATVSKHILQGALLTLSGPTAAMVATDGKRLALATTSREGPDVRIVIPVKALDQLADVEGEVTLTIGPRHLFFDDGRLLTSRTIDGEFPKYERIIPRDNNKTITIERLALTAALKRVGVASEGSRAVWLSLTSGLLELSSKSTEVGTADEPISIGYDGPLLRACVNGDYVLDFLGAAVEQIITMTLKDATSPMLLTDGADHIAVVMMMRG